MKKALLAMLLLLVVAVGLLDSQVGTTTPNLGLFKPNRGTQNWDALVNANFDTLDSVVGGRSPGLDLMRDCQKLTGVKIYADNVNDDGPGIRACYALAAATGRDIYWPKVCHTALGGVANGYCYDYYIATPTPASSPAYAFDLTAAQSIVGTVMEGNQYGQGVLVRFASGMGGFHYRNVGSGIGSGKIIGGQLINTDFDLNTVGTWGVPGSHHGIWYEGTKPYIERVFIQGFDGNGVFIDSTTSFAPDLCTLNDVSVWNVKGNGIKLQGPDSNVCKIDQPNVRLNQLFGIWIQSNYGATIIAPHADANHHDTMGNMSAGVALSSCSRTGNLTTCTSGVNHTLVEQDNIQQTGCADTSFNGFRFRVHVINATQYSYNTEGNEGATGPATVASGACSLVKYSINGRIWSSNSLDGGPYYSSGQLSTWITPYVEGGDARDLAYIQYPDIIISPIAYMGTRPDHYNTAPNVISSTGNMVQRLPLGHGGNSRDINPVTGLPYRAGFYTGDAGPSQPGLDASFGFGSLAAVGSWGSWVRSSATGGGLGGCHESGTENAYNNATYVKGQWGFRTNSSVDTDSCVTTPFWITMFNYSGLVSTTGFPNGFFLGSTGQGTLRYVELANAFGQDAGIPDNQGALALKTVPASGGFLGLVCTTAGAGACTTARAFAPIANDSTGTDWTFPSIGSTTPGAAFLTTLSHGSAKTTWDANGLLTKYNNVTVAGQGVAAAVYGVTSQKSETGADTNVLTVTPPSAAGTYRVTFTMSVSAANTATLGWTATWKDSNGTAQTPTNLALTQVGTAAPALTFVTSAAGNYHGELLIDIDASGTNIVVKTTFTGTSVAAKVTATVQRIN